MKQGLRGIKCLLFLVIALLVGSCSKEEKQETIVPTSIQIKADRADLQVDEEVMLTCEVLDQFGGKMDVSVNWNTNSNGSLSSAFSKTTKLTALEEGEIEVTAELEGITSTQVFTVNSNRVSKYDYLFPSQLDKPKIVFTWLVLVYKKVDIPASSARGHGRIERTLPENVVSEYIKEIENFEQFTAEYTGGEVGFNMAVVVVGEEYPLTSAAWSSNNKKYEWMEGQHIKREMDLYVGNQTGWFDNIHIFYPGMGDWGPSAAYGGGAYMRDNITRSQYHYFTDDKNDWRVGTWHESIHGLEVQYWFDAKRSSTCTRGTAPDGSGIELHGQPAFGYVGNQGPNRPETENYFQWMADLTTGNIRNLLSVGWQNYTSGENMNLGFGKNGMYEWGPVRNEYSFKSGGPFPQE